MVGFVRRVWALGWSMRLLFAALLLIAAGGGLLGATATAPGEDRLAFDALFLSLCALTFGAAAAAGNVRGPLSFVLISPWLAYFSMTATSVLAATRGRPAMALPIATLLFFGLRITLPLPPRVRVPMLAFLTGGAGWLTSGVSGFRAALGVSFEVGVTVLGVLLFALALAASFSRRLREASPPSFGGVLAACTSAMAIVLLGASSVDRAETVSWAVNYFPSLDFLVTLFWFWSGAGFILSLWKVVEWPARRLLRAGLGRVFIPKIPILLVLTGLIEGVIIAATSSGPARALVLEMPGLGAILASTPLAVELTARAHVVVVVSILLLLVRVERAGACSARRLIDLATFALLALLALGAVTSKLVAFATLGASTPSSGPALAAAVIGVLGTVSRLQGNWSETTLRDLALYAAWGATFMAIVIAGRHSPAARIDEHQAVQVFEGMFTLGLPVAVYGRLSRRSPPAARAAARPLVLLFVLGTVAAFGVLQLDARSPRALGLAILPLLVIVLGARLVHPGWDRLAGAMAGATVAAGVTLYWRMPTTFCLPFARAVPDLETLSAWFAARCTLSLEYQLALTLVGISFGALSGWLVFTGRPARSTKK